MNEKMRLHQTGAFTLRQRLPDGTGPYPLMLLLHGWTGDEDSMLVFAGKLPPAAWLVAPRGLYAATQGGYSWSPPRTRKGWPGLDDFRPAVQALLELLTPAHFPGAALDRVDLVGFSQGTALAYAFALIQPQRVRAVAGLSGFLPDGVATFLGSEKPLQGKPVFVSHGAQDDIVPIDMARRSVEFLQQAGAEVTYCEDEAGHKLGADCFSALGSFFAKFS